MYFSLLITRHSKHLLVKFQVPVGMEAIQKACVWPGKEWLIGNSHMLGCRTFSLSQQGRVYPRLYHPILLLLQLHILQLPTDSQSKALCHSNPTFLRSLQCCRLFSYFAKGFSVSQHVHAQFPSMNWQINYKHHHLWLGLYISSLTSTSMTGPGPGVEGALADDLQQQPMLPQEKKTVDQQKRNVKLLIYIMFSSGVWYFCMA